MKWVFRCSCDDGAALLKAQAELIAGYGGSATYGSIMPEGELRSAISGSDNNRGSFVDTLFYEPITFSVTIYLGLFALLVFGGIAIYVGYKTFGLMLICGSVATIAALIFRVLPWFAEQTPG